MGGSFIGLRGREMMDGGDDIILGWFPNCNRATSHGVKVQWIRRNVSQTFCSFDEKAPLFLDPATLQVQLCRINICLSDSALGN
jgi:hypothetical protein